MASLLAPPDSAGRVGRAVHSGVGQSLVRVAVWVVLVAGLAGCLLVGANTPARPHLTNQYLPGLGPSQPTSTLPTVKRRG